MPLPEPHDGPPCELFCRLRPGNANKCGHDADLAQRHAWTQALVCGLSGVPVGQFARGVALGACITMPCQLIVGYLLRNTANVYVATLALVAGPTVVGQFAGVAMVRSPMRRTLAPCFCCT